jgi:hypothetical protein
MISIPPVKPSEDNLCSDNSNPQSFDPNHPQHNPSNFPINASNSNINTGIQTLMPILPAIPLIKAIESFRVLSECPFILMFLFQVYPKAMQKSISQLVHQIMATLELVPQINNVNSRTNARYIDFIACQV